MATIHKELSDRLLEILPTNKDQALTIYKIKGLLTGRLRFLSIETVRKCIKELRVKGVPILWNSRGSYISYQQDAILIQKETIDRMKEGFCTGMNRIKTGYDIALDSDKITIN